MGDLFGRKRLVVIGSFLMTIGTGLTALTHSIAPLFVGQVIAASAPPRSSRRPCRLSSGSRWTAKSRARGILVWTVGIGFGASLGSLIGGTLGTGGDYRPPFLVIAIAAAVAGVLAAIGTTDPRAAQGRRLDWSGQATVVIALVAILYAIIQAPNNGWTSATTLGVLAIGVVFLVVFAIVELRVSEPLLELRLFRIPAFTGAALVARASPACGSASWP